ESGFFVLGPDGQEGIEALAEPERQHGPLPPTARARSGGGGQHFYFALPAEGPPIRTCANINGMPIDVRGRGGYVVAPPSLHRSGNRYVWELSPDEVAPALAPAWLLGLLRCGRGSKKPKPANEKTNLTKQLSLSSLNGTGMTSIIRPSAADN